MGNPQSAPFDVFYSTTISTINLNWQSTETNVTYNVQWDQGTGTWASYTNTTSLSTSLTSLTQGTIYGIQIAAYNILG